MAEQIMVSSGRGKEEQLADSKLLLKLDQERQS